MDVNLSSILAAVLPIRMYWFMYLNINPKRPGLFGQLDIRGGAAAAHFRERRLELPNFHFCPQTVFHMKAGIFS